MLPSQVDMASCQNVMLIHYQTFKNYGPPWMADFAFAADPARRLIL